MQARAQGDPVDTYVCTCRECQTRSGSAFTHATLFPDAKVSLSGEHKAWRRTSDAGRWVEHLFCPTCGVSVLFRGEGLPGLAGIPAGSFDDPEGLAPKRVFWNSRRRHWLEFPEEMPKIETQ